MKYIGKEISRKDSLKKHADHLEDNNIVFATSDGNAFVGERAKTTAYGHAANYRPALEVFNLKEESQAEQTNEVDGEDSDEVTLVSLMKLTAPNLKIEADKIEVSYTDDDVKKTIANAILDKLAEIAEAGE